ncbi:substrate-binding periplasmic protein [Maridesulfovibrio zosterae]|uniref:substrate-binding periplasmic protein n=1 Tax=Maridesulfovibrio zosterae TaxID=82171 RepID=UPI00041063C8|nr:transporter substrate-binding domain-containing protein [Maridesulfovibrio zosterae]
MRFLFFTGFLLFSLCTVSWAENYTLASLNSPPYGYQCGSSASGLDVEIITEAFRRMGDTVTFKFLPWKRALVMAEHGSVDGLFQLLKTAEREKYMYYSDPVRMASMAIFVRKDSEIKFNGDFHRLMGCTFGVIDNYSYGPELDVFIKKNKTKNVEVGESVLMNISKLIKKRFDFFIADDLSTLYTLQSADLDKYIKRLEPLIGKNKVYVSFLKKRNLRNVRDRFNTALKEMTADGTIKRIMEKYRGHKNKHFPSITSAIDCNLKN